MNDAAHNREFIKKMEETINKELEGRFDPYKALEIFYRELGFAHADEMVDGTIGYIDLDAMNDEAIISDFNPKD